MKMLVTILMLLVTMLGAVAAFENDLRKERQADGIALAKRNGVQLGRKKSLTDAQEAELRQRRGQGVKIVELMTDYKISKASVYRKMADGTFPKSFKIGESMSAWRVATIEQWIADRERA